MFDKIFKKEEKFKDSIICRFKSLFTKTSEIFEKSTFSQIDIQKDQFDEISLNGLEESLICADLGANLALELVEKIRNENIRPSEVKKFLRDEFKEILNNNGDNVKLKFIENQLNIYLFCGVNGAGKTTIIGKVANRFESMGKKVLICAGDTFRAAASDQLEIWAKRANAEIIRKDGADPSSVVFEAIKKAKDQKFDLLLIDTAGRLQNKYNLMEELSKIIKTIEKNALEYFTESILTIDANTGQNGISQAKVFAQCAKLTSVALTKIDGTAKGAIILGIAREFKLPTKILGCGESIDDILDFDISNFIEALF